MALRIGGDGRGGRASSRSEGEGEGSGKLGRVKGEFARGRWIEFQRASAEVGLGVAVLSGTG